MKHTYVFSRDDISRLLMESLVKNGCIKEGEAGIADITLTPDDNDNMFSVALGAGTQDDRELANGSLHVIVRDEPYRVGSPFSANSTGYALRKLAEKMKERNIAAEIIKKAAGNYLTRTGAKKATKKRSATKKATAKKVAAKRVTKKKVVK